jgi:hypothetical protein
LFRRFGRRGWTRFRRYGTNRAYRLRSDVSNLVSDAQWAIPVTGFPDPSRHIARVTPICQSARGRISCHRIALHLAGLEGARFFPAPPACRSCCAFLRVAADAVPFPGGASLTPARRAFESPMAMACLADRAPCFPWPMWSISSRTNSPACVVGAFPSCASLRARRIALFSGMEIYYLSLCGRPIMRFCYGTAGAPGNH